MSTDNLTRQPIATSGRESTIRRWIAGPRILIPIGIAIVGAGLALNWGWLTAVGVAPILIAVLPCAAMCALGLCMRRPAARTSAVPSREATDAPESDGQQQS